MYACVEIYRLLKSRHIRAVKRKEAKIEGKKIVSNFLIEFSGTKPIPFPGSLIVFVFARPENGAPENYANCEREPKQRITPIFTVINNQFGDVNWPLETFLIDIY